MPRPRRRRPAADLSAPGRIGVAGPGPGRGLADRVAGPARRNRGCRADLPRLHADDAPARRRRHRADARFHRSAMGRLGQGALGRRHRGASRAGGRRTPAGRPRGAGAPARRGDAVNGLRAVTNPPAAMVILGITVVAWLFQNMNQLESMRLLALWPLATPAQMNFSGVGVIDTGFGPWQLITYGLLHGGIGHLFFNMFALYMFGLPIEQAWGSRRFVIYYLVCIVGAGVVQLATAAATGEIYPTIGASGGVFGLLLAFGMMYPNQRILLLIPPVPIRAKYFVVGYGLLTLFFGVTGTMAGVAHFAHLGGMLFGLGMILYWGRSDYRRRQR